MRRSTFITRALGSVSLVCAAVALSLVFVRHDAPAPRWDIVGALGAAVVTAGAWALACRTAPPLGAAPSVAGERPPLPHRLPLPARDVGRATGTVLLVLTPLVLTRLAAGSGGVLSGLLIILVLVVTVKALLFARGRVGEGVTRSKFRVLADDAARGELHAVRVRVGEPVRMRYLRRGGKPGELDVTQYHWLVLQDGERAIRLSNAPEEVGRAVLRLGGQEGWLCWPQRWKLIEAELPAAFVSDGGEVLMGLTDPDEARSYLTGPRPRRPTARSGACPAPPSSPQPCTPGFSAAPCSRLCSSRPSSTSAPTGCRSCSTGSCASRRRRPWSSSRCAVWGRGPGRCPKVCPGRWRRSRTPRSRDVGGTLGLPGRHAVGDLDRACLRWQVLGPCTDGRRRRRPAPRWGARHRVRAELRGCAVRGRRADWHARTQRRGLIGSRGLCIKVQRCV